MKKHSNDFGNDSVPGLVLRTSIPFMFAQFVNVLYSIVDRIYIGNIPQIGDVSLAGAGICAPVITLLSSFATLIGIGGSKVSNHRKSPDLAPSNASRGHRRIRKKQKISLVQAFPCCSFFPLRLPFCFYC